MTISVAELMSHSFVLSVDERRLRRFNRVFGQFGLLPLPEAYIGRKVDRSGVEYAVNKHFVAAHMSHFEICRLARKRDWPFVCVFEEDAYPCRDVVHRLSDHLIDIPDDAYIYKLGYVRFSEEMMGLPCSGPIECVAERKYCDHYFGGSHAYIVFRRFYEDSEMMLRLFESRFDSLKEIVRMHHPGCLSKNLELAGLWYYEWLMTPNVYLDNRQRHIYHVETCCNLFVQPDYVEWSPCVRDWLGSGCAPTLFRRFLRICASRMPGLYSLWVCLRRWFV